MSTIIPPGDAIACLTSPNVPGNAMFVWQLRMKAGLVIGGVDAFISAITGFSPLEEWAMKPLVGNWDALDRGAAAWRNGGKAIAVVSDNIDTLPSLIGDSWQGETANEFAAAHAKIADAISSLPEAAEAMAEFCAALAELARAIAEFILEILNALAEFAIEMIISLCVPVAGEVAMPAWVTKLGINIGKWAPELVRAIEQFVKFVHKMEPIIEKIQIAMDLIQRIIDALAVLEDATNAALAAGAKADAALT
jgi:uncharacterized protein YukE